MAGSPPPIGEAIHLATGRINWGEENEPYSFNQSDHHTEFDGKGTRDRDTTPKIRGGAGKRRLKQKTNKQTKLKAYKPPFSFR